MIGYIGVPGAMVALPYRGGLSTETDRPATTVRTLGGKRKAFLGPRGRREWSVSFDILAAEDTHGLIALAQHSGPVSWHPADSTGGNLLSPQAAGFAPPPFRSTDGGLTALPDGSVAHSVVRTDAGGLYVGGPPNGTGIEVVPVPPGGGQVSVGVWATGTCRPVALWRDAAGDNLSSSNGPQTTGTTAYTWRTATFTPPAGAVSVGLYFSASESIARPSISWGSEALDVPARGCEYAIVHGLSESLTTINRGHASGAYGSIDVTITEVG